MNRPPQSSIDNYNLVWSYYECTDEEIKFEKKRIMINFDAADRCYSIIAAGIKNVVG